MRQRGRTDQNQKTIVKALRKRGACVISLAPLGNGCPDLLIGWQGQNFLAEIKTPGGHLTPAEQVFFESWSGQAGVAFDLDQVLNMLQGGL